ncbi:hypothetical protein KC851_03685 [Candidatus Kaiserbacteria bacterium]|nr:hypothetical protein [Candidatus Kaiserbacteria bacterium]
MSHDRIEMVWEFNVYEVFPGGDIEIEWFYNLFRGYVTIGPYRTKNNETWARMSACGYEIAEQVTEYFLARNIQQESSGVCVEPDFRRREPEESALPSWINHSVH